jgi:uncharacterized protein YjbI with pentapeptide repeats
MFTGITAVVQPVIVWDCDFKKCDFKNSDFKKCDLKNVIFENAVKRLAKSQFGL